MASLVLYQFPPLGGLPSVSPFCLKVHLALRARGLAYEVVDTLFPRKFNPQGKLPVLRRDGETIVDSSAILAALDEGAEQPFLPRDPVERARAVILEDWADESLFWHAMCFKFVDDSGWERFSKALGQTIPWPIRAVGLIKTRRDHRAVARAQGLLRRPAGQRHREFEQLLDALDALLDGRAHLVGDALSVADIAVASMLLPLMVGLTPEPEAKIARREHLAPWLEDKHQLLRA